LHFWMALASEREFALRFFSLFFGVLTIPLIAVTARRLFADGAVALIAALLATFAPLYIWYSQEARMYTLITFLLLLSSYALLRALARSPAEGEGRRWWLVFALANIAAVYTHYFAFVVIAFQLTFCVLRFILQSPRKTSNFLPAAISFAAIIVAFLPWTPFVIARFGEDASYWRGALKLDEAIRHIFINFTTGESVLESQAQWIAAGWLVALLTGLLAWLLNREFAVGSQRSAIAFSISYLVVPLALLLFLFYRNPKFNARYLMIASPPLFLLLGAGLAGLLSLARRKNIFMRAIAFALSLLTFAFLLFSSAYADSNAYFDPAFTKASFRDVARYIDDHIAPDEAIILTSGHMFPAFNYYYRGDAPTIRLPDDPTLNTDHVLGYDTANVLNQTLAGKRGAWVVLWQDEVVDPNGFVPMLLSSQGKETEIPGTNFYQVRLRHWTLPANAHFSPQPAPAVAREANFKNAVELLGVDSPAPTPADVGASFNLYWQSLDTFNDDYYVALRVFDAAGNLWGKQDRRPAGYNYPTMRWKKGENLFGAYTVPLIAGAPAGDYFVQVTFYTKADESGLDVLAPNGAPIGKSVKVGPIPVLPATRPASFAALNIQNTISQPIGPFTLFGYQLGRDKASAGESIPLTLFWRADTAPTKDYTLRIQFGDVLSDPLPLANAQFATSRWRVGEIVRAQYSISIPAAVQPGTTNLRVALSDSSALDLAPFTIEKTDRVFVKPNVQFAQAANFGNLVALVSYDLPTAVKPGENLKLVLYWQAHDKMDKPYTVFVHLLGSDGKPIAQKDAEPLNGARPTTGWIANEYIADPYDLAIKPDTAPGKYQIEIGWYDAKDPAFARLQILDDNGAPAGDHVILKTTITVQP
jgi:mannosyltransferase